MNGVELHGSLLELEPAHGATISAEKPSARSCSIFIKGFGPEARPCLCLSPTVLWRPFSLIAHVTVQSKVLGSCKPQPCQRSAGAWQFCHIWQQEGCMPACISDRASAILQSLIA